MPSTRAPTFKEGPFVNRQFESLVEHLCTRTSMYVSRSTYDTVCAYLNGYDQGAGGVPLAGFEQWLTVRVGDDNSCAWQGLARERFKPVPADSELSVDKRDSLALGRLLAEFFEYRRTNGVVKIHYEYATWRLSRPWYDGPLRKNQGDDA